MVTFTFREGALGGVDCEDILVEIEDNVVTARSGDLVQVVDYSHGNMGCWRAEDDQWIINVFQEEGMESILYSEGGMELLAGSQEEAMATYKAMRSHLQYDYSYWRD